jgi:hypothetical protein
MEHWLNAMKSSNKAVFFRKMGALGGKTLLFFLPKSSVTVSVVFLESSRIRNSKFRFIRNCCQPSLIGKCPSKFLG